MSLPATDTHASYRTLVVGHGSIGSRHARLLNELGQQVSVVSSKAAPYPRFDSLSAALSGQDFDYIVLATPTSCHHKDLALLGERAFPGLVLVEKPLFATSQELPANLPKHVYVGYNLRFHPLLRRLRQALGTSALFGLHLSVGQHLSTWRPGTDHRQGHTAKVHTGGGVIRELSHELDLALLLAGPWSRVSALSGTFGNLGIEAEDSLAALLVQARCPATSIRLDCLERPGHRQLRAHTAEASFVLDFVRGDFTCNGQVEHLETGRDESYLAMHQSLLSWLGSDRATPAEACTLAQGLAAVKLIEALEQASASAQWVRA